MAKQLEVRADQKCSSCFCDFADHNYDSNRDLYICPHPYQDTGYGGFKGGDPRKFSPDHECCSEQELQAWKDACDKWNEAEASGRKLDPEKLQRCRDENGISGAGWKFGIGVYVIEYEQTWNDH